MIKLYVGDTVRAAKPSEYAGYVEFGTLNGEQLLLNLGEFCGREEVVCPPELLGEEVVVDQADFDVRLGSHGLMVYPDPTSSGPEKYEGVVDHNAYDQFLLDASNLGGEGICQTLSDSQIDGRFTHTYEEEVDGVVTWKAGEKVDGIGSGLAKVFFRGSCAFGALGAALAVWPLIDSMNPAADTLALSTIEADLSAVETGQRITVKWRGSPVFIDRRTDKQLQEAEAVDVSRLRDPQTDAERVIKPEWLVLVGICTHLGCVPLGQKPTDDRGDWGGWFCPCHGSHYDTSGRIRKGPAPTNLVVPVYEFLDDSTVKIG